MPSSEDFDVKEGVIDDRTTDDHDAGIGSSADELETHNPDIDDYDQVVKDMDSDEEPGEAKTTGDSDQDGSGDDSEEKHDPVPYSRFKEINDAKNELQGQMEAFQKEQLESKQLVAQLMGELNALKEMRGKADGSDTAEETKLPFDDVLGLETQQEILDALQEDPRGFLTNFLQRAKVEAQQEEQQRREAESYEASIRKGLNGFAADHDDFFEQLEGLLPVIEEQPMHNIVSAYLMNVEIPKIQEAHKAEMAKVDERIAAAKKEGREEALKEVRAKGAAHVLDGSQSTQGARTSVEPELQDSEAHGGLREILTQKLIRRRESA